MRSVPHQGLANTTPAEHYAPSPRRFDGVLREPHYPADCEVRRVRSNGEIKWRGSRLLISGALAGEPVGLAEAENGAWHVSYGSVAARPHRAWQQPPDRSRRAKPVDLWTTLRVAHRVHRHQQQQQT